MARGQGEKKRKSALYAPVTFVVICAVLVFAMSVFFRVSSIEVVGNEKYTAEEVILAAGIEEGDNLFFINRFNAISRLFSRLPYVEKAAISRSLPNKLLIEVTESDAVAYLTAEDGLWSVDRSCKLLSRISAEDAEELVEVIGLTPVSPEVGQTLAVSEGETTKVAFLSTILNQIVYLKMTNDIEQIDMSNVANPTFDYLGRFTVKLGNNEDVAYKFQVLISAAAQLKNGDAGYIDLSIDGRAHFSYY